MADELECLRTGFGSINELNVNLKTMLADKTNELEQDQRSSIKNESNDGSKNQEADLEINAEEK